MDRVVSNDCTPARGAITSTLLGFRRTADEAALPDSGPSRSGPVIDVRPGVDLHSATGVVSDVGPSPAAARASGLRTRATERGHGDDGRQDRSPDANHDSVSTEKMMMTRTTNPVIRTSADPTAEAERPGTARRLYIGSAIPPTTIASKVTTSSTPQPFSQTTAIGPSDATSAAITRTSRAMTVMSKRSSASIPPSS